MSVPASALIDEVLRHVRDTGGTGTTRAYALSLLSDMQRIVNGRRQDVVDSIDYTVPARSQVALVSTVAPAAIRILRVRQDERDLDPLPWRVVPQVDRRWLARIGARFEAFGVIGKEVLILYPALRLPTTVQLVYVKLTDTLTSESDVIELSDQHHPELVDYVEALALIRLRLFEPLSSVVRRIVARGDAATPALGVGA